MKRVLNPAALVCLAAATLTSSAHGVVVFSENFDTDHSANWTFTSSRANDPADDGYKSEGNAFYDYSLVGVPSANGTGGSTRGMKLVANLPHPTDAGVFSGATMTLNSQSFDFANKNYRITAKVWLNYYGSTTAGTTEELMMGFGTDPGVSQLPGGSFNSVGFATSTDGDTNSDWRAYKTPWPVAGTGGVQTPNSGVYAAGTTEQLITDPGNPLDSANPYYTSRFPGGEVPPPQQQALFPDQQSPTATGMPASAGTVAFAWHTWTIETTANGGPVTWKVDGHTIATIQGGDTNPYTLGGNSIYFTMFDINNGAPPTTVNADKLLFGLIDNVIVEDLSVVAVAGDVNGDGVVNLGDINYVTARWLNAGADGDANGDGVVNLGDINYITARWLNTSAPTGVATSALAAVPEPASLSLLALSNLPFLSRRRSRNR